MFRKIVGSICIFSIFIFFVTRKSISQISSHSSNLGSPTMMKIQKRVAGNKYLRNAAQQSEEIPVRNNKTTIVSAANSDYFEGLSNLIGSINYWEPGRPILVYNLGLSGWQLDELSRMCSVSIHWKDGIPSDLPEHLNSLKKYAWKPFVIKDAVDKYGKVFWMDGGSDLRGHLDVLDKDLERDGFFFVGSLYDKSGMDYLLDPGMYEYLNVSRSDFADKEIFWGTYQGYVKGSFAYEHILKPLVECARAEGCIAPPGSSLENHRYDQSALALMVHKSGVNMTSRQHYDLEEYRREFFESDHTVPSRRILLTGRQGSGEYKEYIQREDEIC